MHNKRLLNSYTPLEITKGDFEKQRRKEKNDMELDMLMNFHTRKPKQDPLQLTPTIYNAPDVLKIAGVMKPKIALKEAEQKYNSIYQYVTDILQNPKMSQSLFGFSKGIV